MSDTYGKCNFRKFHGQCLVQVFGIPGVPHDPHCSALLTVVSLSSRHSTSSKCTRWQQEMHDGCGHHAHVVLAIWCFARASRSTDSSPWLLQHFVLFSCTLCEPSPVAVHLELACEAIRGNKMTAYVALPLSLCKCFGCSFGSLESMAFKIRFIMEAETHQTLAYSSP